MLCREEKGYCLTLSDPEVYVDNYARRRSGHMTHAMTEFAPGTYINFNSSCSAVRASGHSACGFVEYRIFSDYGRTASDVMTLPWSWEALLDGLFTISVEKAVTCPDGSILAYCLRNTMGRPVCCEPWLTPYAVRSRDGGLTWEAPFEVSPHEGRIYDALVVGDRVMFLQVKSADFPCAGPENAYTLFVSVDNGATYTEITLPIEPTGRGYGALLWDESRGLLHAYAYNTKDEYHMDHVVSHDCGDTWKVCDPCYCDRRIRNPQIGVINGVFVLHGREGGSGTGFVFYTSEDGCTWSSALIAADNGPSCYYSENLTLTENGRSRMLVQYSERCAPRHPDAMPSQVDAMHLWVTVERR